MHVTEKSIDFEKITPEEFEELCFEIFLNSNFKSVRWLQGSGDRGRDILAVKHMDEPRLGFSYEEEWAVECKKYQESRGVGLKELSSHFLWADVHLPNHFLIITSSHLTQDARDWIAGNIKSKPYRIKVIERHQLIQIILSHQEIAYRYFVRDKHIALLETAKQAWLINKILPGSELIFLISQGVNYDLWKRSDLALLLLFAYSRHEELSNWCEEQHLRIDVDGIYFHLCNLDRKSSDSEGFALKLGCMGGETENGFSYIIFQYKGPYLVISISSADLLSIQIDIFPENPYQEIFGD